MTTRLVMGMSAAEYHAYPALGSTSLKLFADPDKSLALAKYEMERDEHKAAYDLGTLAHALILEDALDDLVAYVDAPDYRSAGARKERDSAYADGLIPINSTERDTVLGPVEAMRDAVMAHPIAKDLLTGFDPEVSIFWEQDGVQCKARVDALKPGVAVDLKTIRDARPSAVQKQISDLGYYLQAQHYLNGVEAVTGFRPDWYFVMAQNTEPHTVSVHRLHDAVYESAQWRIDYGLQRYRQALEADHWPGYDQIYEQTLPAWETLKNAELQEQENE